MLKEPIFGSPNLLCYTHICVLGQGAFGSVHLAQHADTGQKVAIKIVKKYTNKQQGLSSTLIRELSISKKLLHENIVKFIGFDMEGDPENGYICMQYMESDLQKQLSKGMQMTLPQIKKMLKCILKALEQCHRLRIAHRDIKPANILVNRIQQQYKLADFGLAKQLTAQPCTTEISGLYYRAPELLLNLNTITPAVDIWALGCIFAQCLLRRPLFHPYQQTQLTQLHTILHDLNVQSGLQFCGMRHLAQNVRNMEQKSIGVRHPQLLGLVGEDGVGLLDGMLKVQAGGRLTAGMALRHSFLREEEG